MFFSPVNWFSVSASEIKWNDLFVKRFRIVGVLVLVVFVGSFGWCGNKGSLRCDFDLQCQTFEDLSANGYLWRNRNLCNYYCASQPLSLQGHSERG